MPRGDLGDTEELLELALIKAHDNIIANFNDRHPHLAGEINHLLALPLICRDIVVGELDVMLREKCLCGVAKVASRCAVNGS